MEFKYFHLCIHSFVRLLGVHICVQMCASQGTHVEIIAQLAGVSSLYHTGTPGIKLFLFFQLPKSNCDHIAAGRSKRTEVTAIAQPLSFHGLAMSSEGPPTSNLCKNSTPTLGIFPPEF